MKRSNDGLTVGELTITLGILIVGFSIWSYINKDEKQSFWVGNSQNSIEYSIKGKSL